MLRIDFDERTDVGMQRQENQDSMGRFEGTLGRLFVVCDGMGGHAGGQIASKLAIKTIGERFQAADAQTSPPEALREAIEAANAAVHQHGRDNPELHGMGTTCVALLIDPAVELAYIAHVGDSRIYRITDGELERLTRDHTAVQHLIDQGVLTEEQAALHPRAHVINRSLGVMPEVEVELGEQPLRLAEGQRYLLCSDGLTSMVDDVDIYAEVARHEVGKVSHELIELSNARGGYDNITVQFIQLGDPPPLAPSEGGVGVQVKRRPPRSGIRPKRSRSEWNLAVVMVIATVSVLTLLAIVFAAVK